MRYPYLRLPVTPDAGFPQVVRLLLGTTTYLASYTVVVVDEELLHRDEPLELPRPGAFLMFELARESPTGPTVIFRRKVVPHLEYEADEVALVFTDLAVHPRNLNAAGAHGSVLTGGVALRWAS